MPDVIGPFFAIRGIEPQEVRGAAEDIRRDYWTAVAGFVVEVKDEELRRGLDKDGNPMAALAAYTIAHRKSAMGPADPHAPPLQPAHGLSRTRSLFTVEPTSAADGVFCWWKYDAITGFSWGEMLAIHRAGGRRLPRRDVIGLAPASLEKVKRRADAWWRVAKLGLTAQRMPERFKPRDLGWGKSVVLPDGTVVRVGLEELQGEMRGRLISAAEAVRRRGLLAAERRRLKQLQYKTREHVITLQGGLELGREPPPIFAEMVPKPKLPKPKLKDITTGPVSPAGVKMTPEARLKELSEYTRSFGIPSHVIDTEEFTARFKGAAIDKARAAYDPKTQSIWWNLNAPSWENPVKDFDTMSKEKFLVDPTPSGVVHHEVGHAKLHAELMRRWGLEEGTKRYWDLVRDEFKSDNELKQRIKKVASRLAAIDKNEFIAEIHSGLIIGRVYPKDIMDLYHELGGVRP